MLQIQWRPSQTSTHDPPLTPLSNEDAIHRRSCFLRLLCALPDFPLFFNSLTAMARNEAARALAGVRGVSSASGAMKRSGNASGREMEIKLECEGPESESKSAGIRSRIRSSMFGCDPSFTLEVSCTWSAFLSPDCS